METRRYGESKRKAIAADEPRKGRSSTSSYSEDFTSERQPATISS